MNNQAQAFNVLFTDLMGKILSMADSPGRCADYLAENLRALIGARTVFVLECTHFSGDKLHEIVSVFPERRRQLAYHEAIQEIADRSHDFDEAQLFDPHGDGSIPRALGRLETGPTIVAPIQYATTRMGVLILLDLLDTLGSRTILETLDRLTPVFALVLRNSFLYNNLELEVARRTRELEDRSTRLAQMLREKDVMLKEVHHRVKNNLQIVNSLLFLQADASGDPTVSEALKKSQGRIQSMALVHEELYHSDDLAMVDMAEYVQKLCSGLAGSIEGRGTIVFKPCSLLLPITHSIPCGLILNELMTNALKYAYPENRTGEIRVSMAEEQGIVKLVVDDDGVGLASGHAATNSCSLGLSLVKGLVEQLRGNIVVNDRTTDGTGGRGVRFEVDFPRDA